MREVETMNDIVYLATIVGFFALSEAYARFLSRL
jgi:hypothetical protein